MGFIAQQRKPESFIIEGNCHIVSKVDVPRVQSLQIEMEDAGQRLDNFLVRQLKGVPRSHIQRLIRSGQVRVDGKRAAASSKLLAGQSLRIPPVRQSRRDTAAARQYIPQREFSILHEDEALLAIDKPSGVAVHGGSGLSFGIIEQLRRTRAQARMLELVHRLDRETSGLLLVAKKRSALRALQMQFRERVVGKTYLALVLGEWPRSCQLIDLPLRRYVRADGERRVCVTAADDPQALQAVTRVRVQEYFAGYSLLEVRIKTGRTHQIRVHLAAQGHPIAGDDKYGDFDRNHNLRKKGLKRMFLHAWKLSFQHPASQLQMQLLAPLAADLQAFKSRLEAKA